MDKRKVPRYKRRIPLQFWSLQDRTPRKGFTQNVSVQGMFVSTGSPFKPGTRIFVEIAAGKEKLLFQADVRYSARVDPALHRVKPSGMGVRLLRVDEIMAEILRLKASGVDVVESAAPVVAGTVVVGAEAKSAGSAAAEPEPEATVYPITFETPHDMATSFERDIKYGGLFVAASEPAEKDQQVLIEFRFAWDEEQIVRVQAQVVKRFASAEGSVVGEAVSGMGVAFSDPPEVLAQFRDVFSTLEQQGDSPGG